MEVEIKYTPFNTMLIQAISDYPNETLAELYGLKSNSTAPEKFSIDYIVRIRPKEQDQESITADSKSQKRVDRNLRKIVTSKLIGDFHTHILDDEEMQQKPRNITNLIEILDEKATLSKKDKRSMEKNRNYTYLVLVIAPRYLNLRRWRVTKQGDLLGATIDYNYYLKAYYYERRLKDFARARIDCRFATGLLNDS